MNKTKLAAIIFSSLVFLITFGMLSGLFIKLELMDRILLFKNIEQFCFTFISFIFSLICAILFHKKEWGIEE